MKIRLRTDKGDAFATITGDMAVTVLGSCMPYLDFAYNSTGGKVYKFNEDRAMSIGDCRIHFFEDYKLIILK